MIRPAAGGVAYVAESCAKELRSRGVDVTELVAAEGGSPASQGLRSVWRQRKRIGAADVIHVELGSTALSGFWMAFWVSLIRGHLVMVLHDGPQMVDAPGSGAIVTRAGRRDAIAHKILSPVLDSTLRRQIERRTAIWVAPNDQTSDALRAAGLTPVAVVPIGADAATQTLRPSQCDTVVYAGFIAPAKGLDILADAWAEIATVTDLRLLVIGQPERQHAAYAQDVRNRLAKLGPSVTWIGWVGDGEFNAAIASAAIVVLPYRRSNPVSGIMLRAAAEGRAIIGSSVPAVTHYLEDGTTAVIVEPDDVGALGRAILMLSSDPKERDALGAAVGRWAKEHLTWARQVDELLKVYET
jgi:glycosyltransferase involved in cell wall biosynthesis